MSAPFTKQEAQKVLDELPDRYRGPGGAVAVLQDGELMAEKVWGFANLDDRIPMTPDTIVPICSISKQMVCALLYELDTDGNLREQLAAKLGDILPAELLRGNKLTVDHLAHNQSGIRDYWALSALWGTKPEDQFTLDAHAVLARQRLKSFHFEPGSEYSYCNTNYHILGRLLEAVTHTPLEDLLAKHIFRPAGMETAILLPDSAKEPKQQPVSSPTNPHHHHHPMATGYEGTESTGYTAAVNRIHWSGDAGILASLRDMISYEKYLNASLEYPQSWYNLSRGATGSENVVTYSDGKPAPYQNGLATVDVTGVKTIGHGGALRGWRLYRLQAPEKRVSVVVLFNHESDSFGAAANVLKGVLGISSQEDEEKPEGTPDWDGVFLDEDTGLAVTLIRGSGEGDEKGKLTMRYGPAAETLKFVVDDQLGGLVAKSPGAGGVTARISLAEGGTWFEVDRPKDNRKLTGWKIGPLGDRVKDTDRSPEAAAYRTQRASSAKDVVGTYRCDEIGSTFHCYAAGDGILYGAFDGFMGKGPVNLLKYLGKSDVWAFACPRGLDAKPPGDWTMIFHREEGLDGSRVVGITVGCWLARKLKYVRI